jgi:hypothetical protein
MLDSRLQQAESKPGVTSNSAKKSTNRNGRPTSEKVNPQLIKIEAILIKNIFSNYFISITFQQRR